MLDASRTSCENEFPSDDAPYSHKNLKFKVLPQLRVRADDPELTTFPISLSEIFRLLAACEDKDKTLGILHECRLRVKLKLIDVDHWKPS